LTIYCIAEIGINHNGDLETAKKLIEAAADADFDCVKFQKRTIDLVYTEAELAAPRPTPFGKTNGDLKRKLEFGKDEYDEIDRYCKFLGIEWTASVWDHEALDFICAYDVPFIKIPSALLTHNVLVSEVIDRGKPVMLSTGMSTMEEIDHAVSLFVYGYPPKTINHVPTLLHCTSTYPAADDELNLRCIQTLRERHGCRVGYSGHEKGLATTIAAIGLGATVIERHVTLDRTAFGTDQAASVEVAGFRRMMRDIRAVEKALGDGVKRVYDSELPVKEKLRRH
jgi:N-acetylneuraminate synthase